MLPIRRNNKINPRFFTLCLAGVRASLDLFDKAGMDRLRAKSLLLTAYLEHLIGTELNVHRENVRIFTPTEPSQRGCQLSLTFLQHDVESINQELYRKGKCVTFVTFSDILFIVHFLINLFLFGKCITI